MAQVIIGGSDVFNLLAYGRKNPATVAYLEQQVQAPSQYLTEMGQRFFADSQQIFDRLHSAEALRAAEAAVSKVRAIWQPDSIRPLTELYGLQNAPLVMQRWIMANPLVRQAYHQQRLDGFADTYVDMHPDSLGRDHYDWRRVHDGLLVETPENPHYDWEMSHFVSDELLEGDEELSLEKKVDILTTWDFVEAYYRQGKDDPTSPVGGKL